MFPSHKSLGTEKGQDDGSRTKDKSLSYFHAEAATSASEDAADGYQAPSLVAAGADPQGVALLAALSRLPVAFLYSRVPMVMRNPGNRKKALLILASIDALSWLPLIAVLIFLRPVSPLWLIVCWLVNLIPGALALPTRDSWLADTIPAKVMGRYLGLRAFISAAVYLAMFYFMGYILDLFAGQVFTGFAIVLAIAFVASLSKTMVFSRMRDAADPAKRQVRFGLADFVEETRKGALGKFILYVSLLNFATYLCSPFFAVYMVTELKLSYMTFAIVFSSDFIARALSSSLWGRYSDRVGALPLLDRISYLMPMIPLLWLVSSNVVYLVLIQLFSGTVWAGFEVCSQSLVYKSASPEKRSGYIVFQRSLTTLGQAMGALVGAFAFSFMFPVLGSRVFGLFALSGALRFAVARAVLPAVFRQRQAAVPARHGPAVKPGLYNRPQDWPDYVRGFVEGHSPAPASPKPVLAHGLYHRPKDWADYITPAAKTTAAASAKPMPARGLYHRPQDWADYARPAVAPTPTPARGLFHSTQQWAGHVRQSPPGARPIAPERVSRLSAAPVRKRFSSKPRLSFSYA